MRNSYHSTRVNILSSTNLQENGPTDTRNEYAFSIPLRSMKLKYSISPVCIQEMRSISVSHQHVPVHSIHYNSTHRQILIQHKLSSKSSHVTCPQCFQNPTTLARLYSHYQECLNPAQQVFKKKISLQIILYLKKKSGKFFSSNQRRKTFFKTDQVTCNRLFAACQCPSAKEGLQFIKLCW